MHATGPLASTARPRSAALASRQRQSPTRDSQKVRKAPVRHVMRIGSTSTIRPTATKKRLVAKTKAATMPLLGPRRRFPNQAISPYVAKQAIIEGSRIPNSPPKKARVGLAIQYRRIGFSNHGLPL